VLLRVVLFSFLLLLLPSTVHAQKRVALVIGNSSYQHAGELANPKNDATDMAASLRSAGFQVIEGYDLNKAALDRKIRDFATALRGAQAGLFFYAGHGLQVSGQNYIVPVDAELTTESALDFEMVRLDLVHRTMEREAPTNILILDACRNNPLARNLARAMGTRSAAIGRGLAAVESGAGTLISFSTQPGNVALDGAGRNSPFAGALVKHMSSSQDDLGSILIAVRNDVMEETQRKQVPWEHSAMTGRFYFKAPMAVPPSTTPSQAALSEAERAWSVVKDTKSVALLESFITRYKDTFYAEVARERIELLKANIGSTSVQPVSPPVVPNLAKSAAAPASPPTRVRGTVEAVNGSMLTVKSRDGRTTYNVEMTDNVAVRGIVKAPLSDIKDNSFIGVTGLPQADGSQKAVEIHIFPEPMRGVGEGHRPWDLLPNSTLTNATVARVRGDEILLTYKEGEKKIIVAPETIIVTYVPGSKDELKPGAKIFIAGANKRNDGTLEAASISVGRGGLTPPM
jgi:uncharacterized caspase-like protein